MHITVRQTGGYAGGESVSSVDTSRLDASRRSRLEQLVRDAATAVAGGHEAIGADLMRYEITVRENGTVRSLAWTDDGAMGSVKQLIDEVRELSS
jgi:hypothetical protein